jgi:hypothetical protein
MPRQCPACYSFLRADTTCTKCSSPWFSRKDKQTFGGCGALLVIALGLVQLAEVVRGMFEHGFDLYFILLLPIAIAVYGGIAFALFYWAARQ